jgi:hypothetical protein
MSYNWPNNITILGMQSLLHGPGLNLWWTKIVITTCHVGAMMDLDPTWRNRRNRFVMTSVTNLYVSLNLWHHEIRSCHTTRNYLIYDAFSATFSESVTNVHCSPKHCDDLFNSSRFYDVFLFFVTGVHWCPKHCDDLLNSSRFYDIFFFSSRMYIDGYWSPKHHDDLLNSSQSGPQHHDVWADSSRAVNKK